MADVYTPLFDDIVHIFGGKQVDKQFKSDISVALYPLPKFPVMIYYWLPEDGMDSITFSSIKEPIETLTSARFSRLISNWPKCSRRSP